MENDEIIKKIVGCDLKEKEEYLKEIVNKANLMNNEKLALLNAIIDFMRNQKCG